jgi:hypothetical protein
VAAVNNCLPYTACHRNPYSRSRLIYKLQLQDIKCGVRCAISTTKINGRIFFSDITNSEKISHTIFKNLSAEVMKEGFFQQESATIHTVSNSMTALHNILETK